MTLTAASRPWLKTYATLGLDWNTVPDFPDMNLADYIAGYADSHSNHTALVYLGHCISYKELDNLGNHLANALKKLGCQAGDVIGIHLPNTPQYIVAWVAAAKLGMVVTSISALLTGPEIAFQVNDSKAKVLLSLDALFNHAVKPVLDQMPGLHTVLLSSATELLPGAPRAKAPEHTGKTRVLDLATAMDAADASPVSHRTGKDDIIFLQYTGGTTGKPKGAQLSLRNIIGNNYQVDVFNQYRIGEEVIASAFPMFHIGGTAVTFNALRAGATFIVVPDPRDIPTFVAQMKAHPPTALMNVPALFQMLLASEDFRSLDFSKLRLAVTAAAPFSVDELKKLEAVIGAGKMSEVYGMTETGPVQTCNPASAFRLGYVGIPLPGTDMRLVNPENHAQEVALGEPGEIIVTGPQVMKGYLGSGDNSALIEREGKVWMMTGDIGIMDEDGYVRICDRSKDMIIVGGYKVFSVEVESKLAALPFVAMSAAVGKPDEARPGNEIVQLYVQKKPGVTLSDDEARAEITTFCRANMAPYKVPKEIHFLDAIPLTSVGKIDKKALRPKKA